MSDPAEGWSYSIDDPATTYTIHDLEAMTHVAADAGTELATRAVTFIRAVHDETGIELTLQLNIPLEKLGSIVAVLHTVAIDLRDRGLLP